jgi:hypothetical protein
VSKFSHAVLAIFQPQGLSRNPSTIGLEKSALCMCRSFERAEELRWFYGHLPDDQFINRGNFGVTTEEVYEHQGKYYLKDGSVVP